MKKKIEEKYLIAKYKTYDCENNFVTKFSKK